MKENIGIKFVVDPKSVKALKKSIIKILKAGDNKTTRHALDVLSKSISMGGNVVSGCHFDMGKSKGEDHE